MPESEVMIVPPLMAAEVTVTEYANEMRIRPSRVQWLIELRRLAPIARRPRSEWAREFADLMTQGY